MRHRSAALGAAAAILVACAVRQAAAQPVPAQPAPDLPPPGSLRDGRGRLMQTQFDMDRRFWLGGGWAPLVSQDGRRTAARGGLEVGSRIETMSDDGRQRGRFRLLEGSAVLGPLEAQGTLVRYDESRETSRPVLRVTTFWPGPARHDLYLNLGFWGEVMGVELRPRGSEGETLLRFGALGATWDLWHSVDLEDYVRLRVGAALDNHVDTERDRDVAVTGIAHLEGDVVVDPGGFHHVTADAGFEAPVVLQRNDRPVIQRKLSGSLGYELIFLAVNDQPITLRLAGTGGYRDDLAPEARGWDLGANVGMRVNFWAPPPRPRPAPEPRRRAMVP